MWIKSLCIEFSRLAFDDARRDDRRDLSTRHGALLGLAHAARVLSAHASCDPALVAQLCDVVPQLELARSL